MPNAPALEKRVLDATILAISETNPLLVSAIKRIIADQDCEKLRYNGHSTMYRIDLATPAAEGVLAALADYAKEFDDPALVLLNNASLEQLIHVWSMVVRGLKEIRAPFEGE